MNALAREHVGQGNARRQHSYPDFTALGLGALLFNHLQCIGSTVVGDDDSRVSHESSCSLVSILFGVPEVSLVSQTRGG
jgi:hypothetical protein